MGELYGQRKVNCLLQRPKGCSSRQSRWGSKVGLEHHQPVVIATKKAINELSVLLDSAYLIDQFLIYFIALL